MCHKFCISVKIFRVTSQNCTIGKFMPLANLCHCAYRDERNIGASASDLFPQKCASDGSKMVALMAVVALFFHVKHNITANQQILGRQHGYFQFCVTDCSMEQKLQSVVTQPKTIAYWACTETIWVLCTFAASSWKQMRIPLLGRSQPMLLMVLSPSLSR